MTRTASAIQATNNRKLRASLRWVSHRPSGYDGRSSILLGDRNVANTENHRKQPWILRIRRFGLPGPARG
jgi:hypothetical protein